MTEWTSPSGFRYRTAPPRAVREHLEAIARGETMLIGWASFTPLDKARVEACRKRMRGLGRDRNETDSLDRVVRFVMDDWLARTARGGDTNLQGGGRENAVAGL